MTDENGNSVPLPERGMSDQEIESRFNELQQRIEAAFPQPSTDSSKLRREKADENARQRAENEFLQSPVGTRLQRIDLRLTQLEARIDQFRGEDGITNDGPIFRLERRASTGGSTFRLAVQEEGLPITGQATTLNFVGDMITATVSGTVVTITLDDSGLSPAIAILEEDDEITAAVESIKFVGETIEATAAGNDVTVTMSELVWRANVGGAATDFNVASKLVE